MKLWRSPAFNTLQVPGWRLAAEQQHSTSSTVERIVKSVLPTERWRLSERVQQRTVERTIDFPTPQTVEEIVNVTTVVPQERVANWPLEIVQDASIPQTAEEIFSVTAVVPQEHVRTAWWHGSWMC
eukprot:4388290-Amphidinium_carterae.1